MSVCACVCVCILVFMFVFVFVIVIVLVYVLVFVCVLFPQHLVEGFLNFRRRVCRSSWLDLPFPDPPCNIAGRLLSLLLLFIPMQPWCLELGTCYLNFTRRPSTPQILKTNEKSIFSTLQLSKSIILFSCTSGV